MGLETGTFINHLNINNPEPLDKRRFGDDHLRLIKKTLRNSFPNVTGAVNATHAQMNFLVGVTSAIQAQLDSKLTSADIDLAPYARLDTRQTWTRNQTMNKQDLGDVSGTVTLNVALSSFFRVRATDNLIITITNAVEGSDLWVKLVNRKQSTPPVITLPGNMHFPFQETPQLTQTFGNFDIIIGKFLDNAWHCGLLRDLRIS